MKTTPISSNSHINFTSKIKLVSLEKFYTTTAFFPANNLVDDPWGAEQIIRAQKALTTGVRSCSAGGIVTKNAKNKLDVVMFHLAPKDENPSNKNFGDIEQTILQKLGNNKPLQGFLLGSKKVCDQSVDMFENFESLFKGLGIPYSKLQGLPRFAKAHVAYNGKKDEWLVYVVDTIKKSNNEKQLVEFFDEIKLCPKDKLVTQDSWFTKILDSIGLK